MCGIVGAVASRDIAAILLDGLKRLEYRGYDSAGIAVISAANQPIKRLRTQGKVSTLANALAKQPLCGHTGIAHTRWATHGKPSERNAHPHLSGDEIAVVHNGIIENYQTLQDKLEQRGYTFSSDTDTEAVAHLLHYHLLHHKDLLPAVQATVAELQGAYALGLLSHAAPGRLVAVRYGSPLVIGYGINEMFIASDPLALLPMTRRFVYLEEGDIADIRSDRVRIVAADGNEVERQLHTLDMGIDVAKRGPYRHYMMKEIAEQPQAVSATLRDRVIGTQIDPQIFTGQGREAIVARVKRLRIVACGTSYHAALVGRHWIEQLAGLPCQVEVASEYRYRADVVEADTLFVTLSQSGETADTLAALQKAKHADFLASLTICNVAESSLVRESDYAFMTRAGSEIGVASTKAFTTQLVALLLLALALAQQRNIAPDLQRQLIEQLKQLPTLMKQVLALDKTIKKLADDFANKQHTLFIGRGAHYPIAMEGALKLKEISYIHAEAYPAGELKHGPLALVDKNMIVVALVPCDDVLEKIKSNLNEVKTRGGQCVVIADEAADLAADSDMRVLTMPAVDIHLAPILYTLPLQMLAYHVAVLKGTDVDQPRNLAKSVTVE